MAYPTPIVEIAFADGPYVASPTWTNVTQYVRGMSIDRGRTDDWGNFYSSASVTFSNRDRRFDPFNTSGPYYANLIPRRQIRIRATANAATYDVFRGFIDGWPPIWTDAGQDSTVTVSCFDAMGLLGSQTLPADWARGYILSTTPVHYYPCDEPIPPFTAGTVLNDYGSYPNNLITTATASSGSQLATGLVNSSVKGVNAAGTAVGAIVGSLSFTVSAWLSMGSPDDGITGETYSSPWSIGFDPATSKIVIINYDPVSLSVRTHTSDAAFDMSVPHMVSFAFNPNTSFQMFVDGVPVTHTGTNVATVFVILGDYCNVIGGEAQQIVVWQGIQTTTVIQNIYKYSTVAFSESTSARFNRIIGETSFPAGLTSVPASPASTVLDITDDAPTVASELQKVADSEYGPLFVTKNGTLTMYRQNQIRTQTRSTVNQMTLGVSGIPIGQNVALSYDGDSLRNIANVTMSQGGVWVKKNTTSISARGAAEATIDTQVATLANAQSIADIVTDWGGKVYANAEPIQIMTLSDSQWATVLDRELNDRFTVNIQPPSGNQISLQMLLSRISHSVVPGEWQTFVQGSVRWATAVP